jgi:hypothetical protein
MESTAQYWRSVWLELEPHIRLHLAQAFSNRAPRGRKHFLTVSTQISHSPSVFLACKFARISIPVSGRQDKESHAHSSTSTGLLSSTHLNF